MKINFWQPKCSNKTYPTWLKIEYACLKNLFFLLKNPENREKVFEDRVEEIPSALVSCLCRQKKEQVCPNVSHRQGTPHEMAFLGSKSSNTSKIVKNRKFPKGVVHKNVEIRVVLEVNVG